MDPKVEEWLSAEESEEDLADAAFLAVFSALPRVEPSAGFLGRTARAVRWARRRRRAATALPRAAAALLVAAAALFSAYWLMIPVARGAGHGVAVLSQALVRLLFMVGDGVAWWSVAARAAATLGEALVTPKTTAAFIVVEFVAASALFMLQRLVGHEMVDRNSEEARA